MRISDWSSDVCSSDLLLPSDLRRPVLLARFDLSSEITLYYFVLVVVAGAAWTRSEEHTSELQSLMRISYAVFCLKKKKSKPTNKIHKNNKINIYLTTHYIHTNHSLY